jgi:predicted esterase
MHPSFNVVINGLFQQHDFEVDLGKVVFVGFSHGPIMALMKTSGGPAGKVQEARSGAP